MNDKLMEKIEKQYITTKKLKDAISTMESKCKVGLGARVEVYIKGKDERYEIVGISHYHAIPNLILEVDEVKDNEAK